MDLTKPKKETGMDHDEMIDAIHHIARAIQRLGNADAATPMGGLEALGAATLEGSRAIAGGLHDVAAAIRETSE